MGNYKRVILPEGKVGFIASDSNNKVEFVIKNGIPVNVVYGKEYSAMKRDIGGCYNALSMLAEISIDCFIELVQELNPNAFCHKRAIHILREITSGTNLEYEILAHQLEKINTILETAPK